MAEVTALGVMVCTVVLVAGGLWTWLWTSINASSRETRRQMTGTTRAKIGEAEAESLVQIEGQAVALDDMPSHPLTDEPVLYLRGWVTLEMPGKRKEVRVGALDVSPFDALYVSDGTGTARFPLTGADVGDVPTQNDIQRWPTWEEVPAALRDALPRSPSKNELELALSVRWFEQRVAPGDPVYVRGMARRERDAARSGYRGQGEVLAFDPNLEPIVLGAGTYDDVWKDHAPEKALVGCGVVVMGVGVAGILYSMLALG